MTYLNYDLSPELYRKVKVAAALEGVTIKQFLEDALRKALEVGKDDIADQ